MLQLIHVTLPHLPVRNNLNAVIKVFGSHTGSIHQDHRNSHSEKMWTWRVFVQENFKFKKEIMVNLQDIAILRCCIMSCNFSLHMHTNLFKNNTCISRLFQCILLLQRAQETGQWAGMGKEQKKYVSLETSSCLWTPSVIFIYSSSFLLWSGKKRS